MNEWFPIATAPHSARKILLWWRGSGCAVGHWSVQLSLNGQHKFAGWCRVQDKAVPKNQEDCTHWMELPPEPEGVEQYQLCVGTVQCYVSGFKAPPFLHHFGRTEYDSAKQILTVSLEQQAQPIVDKLNRNETSEPEARILLNGITY